MDSKENQQLTEREQNELIQFGKTQMLHYGINVLIMLAISQGVGLRPGQAVLFYVSYSAIRMFAGGIHADSRGGCYVYSILFLSLSFLILKNIEPDSRMILAADISSVLFLLLCAPVENKEKRLSEREKSIFRRRTYLVLGIEEILVGLCMLFNFRSAAATIVLALLAESMMAGMGKIENVWLEKRIRRKEREEGIL